MIEDVTGLPFAEAARRHLFEPLGMDRSTYENPLPAEHGDVAHAHGPEGAPPYGLGPEVGGDGPMRNFVHSRANDSYRAFMAGYLAEGDGLVILTNGPRGSELIFEIRRAVDLAGWPSH